MCVICAKAKGVEMPTKEIIHNMWVNNNDGAGIMYVNDGRVRIEKGFMTYESFNARITELEEKYDLKNMPVVMHFRITTHGGTKPENCHPFPLTDSIAVMQKTKSSAKVGIAHNGIIDIATRSKDISDTMEYIASQLAPLSKAVPEWYKNKYLMQMVENAIESKMCILNDKGQMYTIGKFEEHEGILYSNKSYSYNLKSHPNVYGMYNYGGGWYDYDFDENMEYFAMSVMWLDEGDYIITKDGKRKEADIEMYAIDDRGDLYVYDYDYGALTCASGTAYSYNNVPKRYDDAKAYEELIAI